MVQIRLLKKEDINNVSSFIAKVNTIEESHIGYCGKDKEEIAHSLKEDLTDINYSESFIVAYVEDEIIGVLGFDADLDDNSAEIWGPFISENKWDVVLSMWRKMIDLLPIELNSLRLFPNKKNKQVVELARNFGFKEHSEQTILKFNRNNKHALEDVSTIELTENLFTEMKLLHEMAFPGAYYSGQQIIERLNEHRKVFVIRENNNLFGYIYVETEPDFGEASIEFFAVNEAERGKGIGGKLLTVALNWIFSFETIEVITLCVNSSNDKAINLYKKIGFLHAHDLCDFTKNI